MQTVCRPPSETPELKATHGKVVASMLEELYLRGPSEGKSWKAENDLCLALAWHRTEWRKGNSASTVDHGVLEMLSQLAMQSKPAEMANPMI